MPRGGSRAGAGRPKGTTGIKHASTLSKEAAREALREIVKEHMAEMVAAQIAAAKGLKYLIVRNKKTGKFEKLTEEIAKTILEGTDPEALEAIEVWEQAPNVQAFTDLMNRTLDMPAKPVEETKNDVKVEISWKSSE